jgi:hypothetical protein
MAAGPRSAAGWRERRKLMILQPQAFIDDSVGQPIRKHLVLAGFVSSAAAWAAFAHDWQAVLDLEPKLDYFKNNEANLLVEQFSPDRGWTEAKRDDRLISLIRVIKKHALIRIHASIKYSDFEEHIASIAVPQRKLISDNPYIYLFTKMICAMAVRSTLFNINEPCDFIFDEQAGYSEEIFYYWPIFKQIAASRSRSDFPTFIGGRPQFQNDVDFLPLQASDLFAGHLRFHLDRNIGRIMVPPNRFLHQLLTIPAIPHDTTAEELLHLRSHLLEFQEKFITQNPSTKLIGLAPTIRERRSNRKRGRAEAKKATSPSLRRQSS